MKNKKIMLGSAIMLAVLLVAGGTMAWFTAQSDPVTNNFKAGTLKIKINDTFNPEAAENVNPGDKYSKVVNITNTGTKRAYIRVKLTPAFMTVDANNQPVVSNLDTSVVTYPILPNWILHNGYYYYKNIVGAGVTTTDIINEVKFAGAAMNNNYQGAKFTLKVEADAIQATNGAINDAWLVNPATLGLEVLP